MSFENPLWGATKIHGELRAESRPLQCLSLPRRECILSDVSDRGARLTITAPNDLPEEFILLFSADRSTHRYCRVVWRSDAQVGVEFLGHPGMPAIRRLSMA